MTGFPHNRSVIDAHVHFTPDVAETVAEIMETNCISRVVNLGAPWVRGILRASCLKLHSWRGVLLCHP